jgi:uncharacterized protein (TIGR03435 family)
MIPLANHLWQSTIFAAVVALLSLLLRHNRAQTRYWLWLAASVKFLVPFSLLVSAGSLIEWRSAPAMPIAVEQIAQPFEPLPQLPVLPVAQTEAPSLWWAALWICGCAALLGFWLARWRGMRLMLRAATPLTIDAPIPVMSSPSLVEPGVFGVFRPVLLLPCGITSHLTAEQLQAILDHELCHVRRRDNLAAALHMLVECAFWFHPLVWWIGQRLVDERERACDEEVIRAGNQPLAYAEGILNVCKFYVQSPLACASGVTGADLRKRVTAILTNRTAHKLTAARKLVLAAAALVAIAVPVMIGVVRAQAPTPADTPKFDVAVIKPSNPDAQNSRLNRGAGGSLKVENIDLKHLISFAYDVRDFQITGGPNWVGTARWDINAKPDRPGPADPKTMTDAERRSDMELMRLRIRSLIEERFQLVVHRETKELPVYALVQAKGGSRLSLSKEGEFSNQNMNMNRGRIQAQRATMQMMTNALSQRLGRPVQDETGLTGTYDFTLEWTPDSSTGEAAEGASIFTAIQEQLGLKLESKKAPAPIVVIDKVEKPSEN